MRALLKTELLIPLPLESVISMRSSFKKTDVYSSKKNPVTIKNDQKNNWKHFNKKSDKNIINTVVIYAYSRNFVILNSIYNEISHLLSSPSTGFNVSLINMHIFFLKTFQNKQTRVLGESPVEDRTKDISPI